MDTCGNSCEKSHRRERVKEERVSRKKIREEKESEKKEEEERMIKVREPVGESRNTVFSQRFVAPEGRQVGSLKQQVRSHMAGWDPNVIWRDADLEVKKLRTSHVRSNFGNWAVEKVHPVPARSKFRRPNGTKLSALHSTFHFWRKPRRVASFWICQLSLLKEVSQNCFVLHLSTATFAGRLAELLRFAPVNCYFLRKSRTIASFQIDG